MQRGTRLRNAMQREEGWREAAAAKDLYGRQKRRRWRQLAAQLAWRIPFWRWRWRGGGAMASKAASASGGKRHQNGVAA